MDFIKMSNGDMLLTNSPYVEFLVVYQCLNQSESFNLKQWCIQWPVFKYNCCCIKCVRRALLLMKRQNILQ